MMSTRWKLTNCVASLVLLAGGTAWGALPINGRIAQVNGEENISQPYRFEVEVISTSPATALLEMIDTAASFQLPGGRDVAGVIQEVRHLGATREGTRYRLVVGPRLADLRLTRRSRTFHEKTAIDIVIEILEENGISADTGNLTGTFPVRTHVTQFNESDLSFIHRLLEMEGVYYFFEHTSSSAQMVLSDRSIAAPLGRQQLIAAGRQSNLNEFDFGFAKHTGRVRLHNVDFEKPATSLASTASSSRYANLLQEQYAARHTSLDQGSSDANIRLQAFIADALSVQGASRTSAVRAGHRIRLSAHPQPEANQLYFVTRVTHQLDADGNYSNAFNVIPANTPFRPLPNTPTPVAGSALGQISGPAGEEIHVDEYGRVKVMLPWFESSQAAVWARVLQPNSESLWLPRMGEEVAVTFENGDPDRPLVLGTLFNAVLMPPFSLPDTKDVRRLGSSTTPGGQGVNALLFADRAGAELLSLSAARDLRTVANNDKTTVVGNNSSTEIGSAMKLTVGGDQQTTITGQSSTQAQTLLLEGGKQIILRVGKQQLLIDANGVRWTGQTNTSTTKPAATSTISTPKSRLLGRPQ